MSWQSRSLLITEMAERAEVQGRFQTNPLAKFALIEITERQFNVIEPSDFAESDDGVAFVLGVYREKNGTPYAQIWWPSPRCPKCRKPAEMYRIEEGEGDEWVIKCCGTVKEGKIRDVCVWWLGHYQKT